MVAIFVIISNLFFGKTDLTLAVNEDYFYLTVDPVQAAEFLRTTEKYTPFLEENPDEFEFAALVNQSDGFVSKELGDNSAITEISKKDFEYAVQGGDTITTIAAKFNLHVASLIEKNNLDVNSLEKLQPGDKLIIPVEDTSDSIDWLVKLNEKKEVDRQLAIKQEQERQKKLAKQRGKIASSKRSVVYRDSSGYDGYTDGGFIIPISHNGITRGVSRGHAGIDYRADIGTSVKAAADGKIISLTEAWGGGFGMSILVDHGGGRTTRYAHLSGFRIGLGDYVSQGQVIGVSGNTGWSTGPHLHFETRIGGRAVNPF
ncbi:hypothetical protein A3F08_00540 [Candidatus Berkelbacteria bacterium RIFCSPHIGHO2_12_FULL_36_9]|uniref:LysM domain-containing protein n=1 Tax=Candidatus Berkelbacteria bacterium RIFCSPHIGHO2_12_FULL_36_9 TaxID=1797469 RepID=A0A1F5EHR9_9BACT|nr:MAG: hypothetical protein A3F08_00540 [Candidatus Berkelbacteria bacterium RIFCSPHIGHO2_12_FULL_36_9]